MFRTALGLLFLLAWLATGTACAPGAKPLDLSGVIATEPAPATKSEVIRLLCTRDALGRFIWGYTPLSHADSPATQAWDNARADAWDAATGKGADCPAS